MQTLEQTPIAALTPRQRVALISLLVDEDPAIYQFVRGKILSFGPAATEWLRPYCLSGDPVMRRRAIEIIQFQARQVSDQKFVTFCRQQGEDLDLELAVGLLAQTEYPDANLEAYSALYDAWAEELRPRVASLTQPETILAALNHYLFKELGFCGHEQYGYDPECNYINRIVDRRLGNPIGLCAVYLFVARRLRLPVSGIGLPGHFLCRFQGPTKELYVDCFRKGAILTKANCIEYLLNAAHGLAPGQLAPVSSRRMLQRMCGNLHKTYGQLEMGDHVTRLQRYLGALAR